MISSLATVIFPFAGRPDLPQPALALAVVGPPPPAPAALMLAMPPRPPLGPPADAFNELPPLPAVAWLPLLPPLALPAVEGASADPPAPVPAALAAVAPAEGAPAKGAPAAPASELRAPAAPSGIGSLDEQAATVTRSRTLSSVCIRSMVLFFDFKNYHADTNRDTSGFTLCPCRRWSIRSEQHGGRSTARMTAPVLGRHPAACASARVGRHSANNRANQIETRGLRLCPIIEHGLSILGSRWR